MDLTVSELYAVQLKARILHQFEPLKAHFIGTLKLLDQLKGRLLEQLCVLFKQPLKELLKELLNEQLKGRPLQHPAETLIPGLACKVNRISMEKNNIINLKINIILECEDYKKYVTVNILVSTLTASNKQPSGFRVSKCDFFLPLVVGGTTALPDEFPHMVKLLFNFRLIKFFCMTLLASGRDWLDKCFR